MKIIIVGCGNVGITLAEQLSTEDITLRLLIQGSRLLRVYITVMTF